MNAVKMRIGKQLHNIKHNLMTLVHNKFFWQIFMKRSGAALKNCLASLWLEVGGTWFALQGSELNDKL